MRIAIALPAAALIGSTAVADDTVHLKCTGTQFWAGYNMPATVSLVVHPEYVEGGHIGGKIIKSDDQGIGFMMNSSTQTTKDNWRTSTTSDTCVFGRIDRATGKASVTITYGKCDQVVGPPFSGPIATSYDLICTG